MARPVAANHRLEVKAKRELAEPAFVVFCYLGSSNAQSSLFPLDSDGAAEVAGIGVTGYYIHVGVI